MTNAEMYEKIFGMPTAFNCPTSDCNICPCGIKDNKNGIACYASRVDEWWNSEYKQKGGTEGIEKVCKNCDYYFYGQCYGQKNAPKVDANEVHNCWTERK